MKLKSGFKLYAIVTQYLFQTFALVVLGLYLGSKLDTRFDTDTTYSSILGVLGIIIGIISFIFFVLKYGDKNEK